MAEMELRPDSHGKVRDIYDCGDSLLMVASDRISAYDFILPDEIPHKGRDPHAHLRILVRALCRPHPQPHDLLRRGRPPRGVRALRRLPRRPLQCLVKKAQTVPIECIVRGYLTGFRQEDLRPGRHRLRHQAARRAHRGLQAPRADLHPVHQGGARRPRREHLLRALLRDRGHRGRRAAARRLARHLQGRGGLRRDARHHHRRHQVRVRLHRRQAHPHRRVPHAPTPAASGRPRATRRARSSRATTSSTSATGCAPTGT